MLFPVEKVDTNLSYLNEVLKNFILASINENRYYKKKLFPKEFLVVHDNKSNVVDKKFKQAFYSIKNLDGPEKRRLRRMYFNQQRVKRLCNSLTIPIISLDSFPPKLIESLKQLGEYLYSSVLNQKAFTNLANVQETLSGHWSRFKFVNGNVCCFCGINDYEEQLANVPNQNQWKPAYDHYLPKSKYPFAAVCFDNLIPVCFQCNSKAKRSLDPCFCKDKLRHKSFYPYSNYRDKRLKLKANISEVDSESTVFLDDFWSVYLFDEQSSQLISWDRLFDVKRRVKERVNRKYLLWLEEIIDSGFETITKLKATLKSKSVFFENKIREQRGAYHKAMLFQELEALSDEMLLSITNSIRKLPSDEIELMNQFQERF